MNTQVVYAVPYFPPAPPRNPWTGVTMTWQGWDGSVWDLCGSRHSGIRLQQGVRGLTMPPFSMQESESDTRAGSRWLSVRALKRPVVWPLWVWCDGGDQAWLDYDRAFWRTMHPSKPGLWTVTQPSGEYRTLAVRFVDDGDQTWDAAPGMRRWAPYLLTLQAEDPFWRGAPITRAWMVGTPLPFIPDTGAPPFQITAGATFDAATVPNPGDVPAWPVWTITGPCTSVTVGVNGRLVTYAGTVSAGQILTIDSRAMTAKLGTTNVTTGLTVRDFAPIPEGGWDDEVPLSVSMTGTGTISMTLTPAYLRAW